MELSNPIASLVPILVLNTVVTFGDLRFKICDDPV